MRDIGPTELVLILFVLAIFLVPFVIWIKFLVEAIKVPDSQWDAAGQSKILFVLLMVFLGLIGTVLYAVVARKAVLTAGPATPTLPA